MLANVLTGTAIGLTALVLVEPSLAADERDWLQVGERYTFTLRTSAADNLCHAYVRRLSSMKFRKAPYCGREETSAAGFTPLRRTILSPEEIAELWQTVRYFSLGRNQFAGKMDISIESIRREVGLSLFVWRYDAPIDISNDGHPRTILVWQGDEVGFKEGRSLCGEREYPGDPPTGTRVPQVAFVLAPDGKSIDQAETERVFGHPAGNYPSPYEAEFRPIGQSLSIVARNGVYYFETFDDANVGAPAQSNPALDPRSTLRLFRRVGVQTKAMCEVRMHIVKRKRPQLPSTIGDAVGYGARSRTSLVSLAH